MFQLVLDNQYLRITLKANNKIMNESDVDVCSIQCELQFYLTNRNN